MLNPETSAYLQALFGRAPDLPASLAEAYREAVASGAALAESTLSSAEYAADARKIQIALAAFGGNYAMARQLLADEEEDEA